MGYKSIYKVYTKEGKFLGRYSGWTSQDAVKSAMEKYPDEEIGIAKLVSDLSNRL